MGQNSVIFGTGQGQIFKMAKMAIFDFWKSENLIFGKNDSFLPKMGFSGPVRENWPF